MNLTDHFFTGLNFEQSGLEAMFFNWSEYFEQPK